MFTPSPNLEACIAETDLKALRSLLQGIPDRDAKGMAVIKLIASKAPLEKIECFLAAGADVKVTDMHDGVECTALMLASQGRLDCVELLIRYGANVHARNDLGYTPLSFACMRGKISIANLLLESGADIEQLNNNQECVLVAALQAQDHALDMLHFLISKGVQMDNVDYQGLTPLLHSASRCLGDCAKALLKAGANPNFVCAKDRATALLHALRYAAKDAKQALVVVKLLVRHGADVHATGPEGITLLAACCYFASSAPIVQFLLQHGADADPIFQVDSGVEMTSLSVACDYNISAAELLLQAGADPNQIVGESTLLERATRMPTPREPVVHMLLKAGADANLQLEAFTQTSSLLIQEARCQNRATIVHLLQYGAKMPQNLDVKYMYLDSILGWGKKDLLPLFAFPGCGLNVVAEKPKRLTEKELQFNFIFSFCAQCRGERKHEDLMACSGCRIVAYCCKECQHKHWPKHRKICMKKQANDELARTTDNCV